MNWTEGNLARHSRGRQRNELLTRQKQHFAKVRNGLLTDRIKQSPISISFLGNQHSRDLGHREGSGDVSYKPPSSPLLAEKRKRTQHASDDATHQSSIREKKRKLLDKTDWVGLDLQQSINITFPGQLQTSTGSRWGKVDCPRIRAIRKRNEPVDTPRLEVTQEIRTHPLKIQIGSQEIQPSVSTASQPGRRRYSLAPRPLTSSSQRRSNPISSPEPSQARRLYVVSRSSQCSQKPKGERYEMAGERSGVHSKALVMPLLPEEPAHIICSSSTIYEPIPRRNGEFPILKWSPVPSDGLGSTKVEVEHPGRPASLSQEVDQELWRNLAISSSDNPSIPDMSTSPLIVTPSINLRTGVLPFHLQEKLPSFDISSEPEVNSSSQYARLNTNDEFDNQAIISEGTRLPPKQASDHHQEKVESKDDNSTWMKFAFDGNSEEIEAEAFAEAAHQIAAELVPSDTSAGSAGGTETAATYGADSLADNRDERNESIPPEDSSQSHMATHGTVASESVSSNVATAGSVSVVDSESRFRFAQPRTFIGKLADSGAPTAQGPHLMSNRGRKRRGRPKKRATDGRADIRRLPDFDGDPIEEFEDE